MSEKTLEQFFISSKLVIPKIQNPTADNVKDLLDFYDNTPTIPRNKRLIFALSYAIQAFPENSTITQEQVTSLFERFRQLKIIPEPICNYLASKSYERIKLYIHLLDIYIATCIYEGWTIFHTQLLSLQVILNNMDKYLTNIFTIQHETVSVNSFVHQMTQLKNAYDHHVLLDKFKDDWSQLPFDALAKQFDDVARNICIPGSYDPLKDIQKEVFEYQPNIVGDSTHESWNCSLAVELIQKTIGATIQIEAANYVRIKQHFFNNIWKLMYYYQHQWAHLIMSVPREFPTSPELREVYNLFSATPLEDTHLGLLQLFKAGASQYLESIRYISQDMLQLNSWISNEMKNVFARLEKPTFNFNSEPLFSFHGFAEEYHEGEGKYTLIYDSDFGTHQRSCDAKSMQYINHLARQIAQPNQKLQEQ